MNEATEETKALVPFDKLNAGLAGMKKKYSKVPDVQTKEGYAVVKENLKQYRGLKKRVEDTYKVAVEDINKIKDSLLTEKKRILGIVEDVFEPHQTARKDEDERLAEIKREKDEAKAKREREIQGRIDEIRETYASAVSKSSSDIKELISTHADLEINEELFGDDIEIAQAIKSAMAGKLVSLYESKRQQEEESDRIKKESEELAQKQEAQKIEDDKRDKEQRDKEEAERKRMTEENAKLKAENEKLQEGQRKLDEEKAKLEADKKAIEHEKALRENNKKLAEEKAKRDAKEKKDREKAEAKAKAESKQRRASTQSDILLLDIMSPNEIDIFINSVEDGRVSYLKLDWTQK